MSYLVPKDALSKQSEIHQREQSILMAQERVLAQRGWPCNGCSKVDEYGYRYHINHPDADPCDVNCDKWNNWLSMERLKGKNPLWIQEIEMVGGFVGSALDAPEIITRYADEEY